MTNIIIHCFTIRSLKEPQICGNKEEKRYEMSDMKERSMNVRVKKKG